ncbi:MAG TPA: HAMP domain-containing sensor histidine kinase [Pirellulales bacterium]|nr:HAMP domain-containing sensor histidine kinase [Pirellulales bacterium]
MNVAHIDGNEKSGGPRRLLRRSTRATFVCMTVALVSIVALGVWGAGRDLEQARDSFLKSAVAEVVSHAQRTVRHIERDFAQGDVRPDLRQLRSLDWLLAHWHQAILSEEKWSYAAVEDLAGNVVAHSNPALEGQQLCPGWHQRALLQAGADVVETRFAGLTEGRRAFDVRLPVTFNGAVIGTYHAGLNADWFEAAAAAQQDEEQFGWMVVIAGTTLVVLAAVGSLYFIIRQTAALQHRLELSEVRRVNELRQFIVGLAHEVRNPLNAVRLNLHAIGRAYRGEGRLPADEVATIVRESTREITRVAALIGEMLGYARSDPPRVEDVDLKAEVRGTLDLVQQAMEDYHIAVVAHLAPGPLKVRIDRDRLRQILLNLLNNAREAVGKGGRIEIDVSSTTDGLQLAVSDNGPGVPPEQRQRIFDPFFSTKDVGIGLGLTLVKKFVQESGGSIAYDEGYEGGGRFVVRLPDAAPSFEHEVVS